MDRVILIQSANQLLIKYFQNKSFNFSKLRFHILHFENRDINFQLASQIKSSPFPSSKRTKNSFMNKTCIIMKQTQLLQQQLNMGNFGFDSVKPPQSINSKSLKIATLNYCGIAFSPFEFYCQNMEKQLKQISQIFHRLIPRYIKTFDESKFKWDMGKIDKNFKKGRYSNMFDAGVGIFWKTLLNKQQFQEKWQIEFNKNAPKFKFEYKKEEKQTTKLYDFIMYHSLLTFVFKTDSFEEAIKNDATIFYQAIKDFYKLSFLDEQAKIKKFWEGFNKLNPDVFFIQEFSALLLEEIKKSNQYFAVDPRDDSLVILNKQSFKNIEKFQQIIKQINIEQQKSFRWGQSIAFIGADNFIFACIHLSSNEERNKVQIENLKNDLLLLRKSLPHYHLIVGGDLNSFLVAEEKFKDTFDLYPAHPQNHTTSKKRSYAQAQFHKAEKEVRESKDRIISTLKIESGEICYLNGEKISNKIKGSYLPNHEHPFDHLTVWVKVSTQQ